MLELAIYMDYYELLSKQTIIFVKKTLNAHLEQSPSEENFLNKEVIFSVLQKIKQIIASNTKKQTLLKLSNIIEDLKKVVNESALGKSIGIFVEDDNNSDSSSSSEDDDYEAESEQEKETDLSLNELEKRILRSKIGSNRMTKEVIKFYKFMQKADDPYLTFSNMSIQEQQQLLEKINHVNGEQTKSVSNSTVLRILESSMDDHVKAEVFERYRTHLRDKEDDGKFDMWLQTLLKVPFDQLVNPPVISNHKQFFNHAQERLDQAIYGHSQAKLKILQYLGQYINNPNSRGFVMGIRGPMGNGKTTLVERGISTILSRPFIPIPLGGASDASFLNGHNYTYVGSTHGQILDSIIKAGVMNPIIYFDEVDKLSDTPKGQEIMNLLIHLTDPSQNHHYQDRYFGNINFDLSKCILIFSYNHRENINSILLDRIFEVKTEGFAEEDKIQIAKQFLIPDIIHDIGISTVSLSQIVIQDDILHTLIREYTNEMGVRKLKELLYDIYRNYNLDVLTGEMVIQPNKRRRTSSVTTIISQQITREYVIEKCLQHKMPIIPEHVHSQSMVGKINGLYFSDNSNGGIIPIHAVYMYSDKNYELFITGNLGKVMQESSAVAKTVAWNLLTNTQRHELLTKWEVLKTGIHVHCSDTSVPKDGPSAGCALTLALYSLLTNRPINHLLGVTGEIDLAGNVTAIGGLREKLYGAKQAGCQIVLFPFENMKDFYKIKKEHATLFDSTFVVHPVKTIQEAISFAFVN